MAAKETPGNGVKVAMAGGAINREKRNLGVKQRQLRIG